MKPVERLAVALDVPTLDEAVALAEKLEGQVGWFKVGLELFAAHGADAVHAVRSHGPVFLDLKLHDIPTTVERAARRLAQLDVGLVTVHATGGPAMVTGAVEGMAGTGMVLAVTVLTSMSNDDLVATGMDTHDPVGRLAGMATDAGAPGIVCAPGQLAAVRGATPPHTLVVTPGIRPAGAATDDHAAAVTPSGARRAGADLVVVGRPITRDADPAAAAARIVAEIEQADQAP